MEYQNRKDDKARKSGKKADYDRNDVKGNKSSYEGKKFDKGQKFDKEGFDPARKNWEDKKEWNKDQPQQQKYGKDQPNYDEDRFNKNR